MKKISLIFDASILGSVILGGSIRQEFIEILAYIDYLNIYYCNQILQNSKII
jgi:predicted nucleic acid-binding protein